MNGTLVVPSSFRDEIQALTQNLGLVSPEATVTYLLQNAIANENKLLAARMFERGEKTLRQCAEFLHVDLEEVMDIFSELGVNFNPDIEQQLETVKKLARETRAATS